MSEQNDEIKREKVRVIPINLIDDFPDHPCLRCGSRNLFRLPFFYWNGNALLALYARSRTFCGSRFYPV